MISKDKVRKQRLSDRDALEEKYRKEASQRIVDRLRESEAYKNATHVLSYMSYRSEVETKDFNREVLRDGKNLYLPRTYPKDFSMFFYKVEDLNKLIKGNYGILEPVGFKTFFEEKESENIPKERVLLILPCVSFDRKGNRMGYGAGYYDRYLKKMKDSFQKLALAFESQEALIIPCESTDERVDGIITEKEWIKIS